jgi:hypothetical protein
MRIAHMTLWVRWANNILSNNVHQFYNPTRVKPWHRILSVSSVFCVVLWGLSEDSYQVTFRLFSCFEFWCLRFCQKSNYQVTFRLFSCFEFLSEEQLPGDISSVFLFWVLVFEVLSEEQLPGDISCFLVLSFGVWGSVSSNYQVTFRVFLFWVLVFEVLSEVTTRWHFVCFLVLSFGVQGLSEEQLPGDISSVFLFWVLVFEVLSEECYYLVIF